MSSLANFVVAVETQDLAQEAQARLIGMGTIIFWFEKEILTKAQRKRAPMTQF